MKRGLKVGDYVTNKYTKQSGIVTGLYFGGSVDRHEYHIWFDEEFTDKRGVLWGKGGRIVAVSGLNYIRSANVEDKEVLLCHGSLRIRQLAITL